MTDNEMVPGKCTDNEMVSGKCIVSPRFPRQLSQVCWRWRRADQSVLRPQIAGGKVPWRSDRLSRSRISGSAEGMLRAGPWHRCSLAGARALLSCQRTAGPGSGWMHLWASWPCPGLRGWSQLNVQAIAPLMSTVIVARDDPGGDCFPRQSSSPVMAGLQVAVKEPPELALQ